MPVRRGAKKKAFDLLQRRRRGGKKIAMAEKMFPPVSIFPAEAIIRPEAVAAVVS
jgi:hypothetical protein